jgi:hypothetical protein
MGIIYYKIYVHANPTTSAHSGAQFEFVVLLHIITAAISAQAVAPNATYILVLSGGSSSLFGKAVLGFVAASANVTNSSLMLFHVTLTWRGAFMFNAMVYSSGCFSDLWVVLS